jgi:hypothetical protein
VGGFGSGGGDAGTVIVHRGQTSAALLQTKGNNANGITAQSVGGGGGNAGMNFVLEGSLNQTPGAHEALVVIGGRGGDPGHGKTVDVEHIGTIETDGDHSDGILAQSVGGGGGNAAVSIGLGLNKGTKGINFALGGAPGDGGDGEKVTVQHTGDITTQGLDSTAIFAQSIGGGGGNAALTMAVSLLSAGSLDVGLGRFGGTGGMGRDVEVTADGNLQTHGASAVGIRAQSVGNGGGVSGAFSVGLSGPSGQEGSGQSSKGTVAIGLEGGAGGSSGNVDVTTSGSITTSGKDAYAIHAQSVGGGGGVGGSATNIIFRNTNAGGLGIGGQGGTGATSGTVDVTNHGVLTTGGENSHGIYAQSIGGGGGVGGYAGVAKFVFGEPVAQGSFSGTMSFGGKGGTGANSSMVDVTNTGTIVTTGAKAFGVNAQSIGGGGGDGGMVINGSIAGGSSAKAIAVNVGGDGNIGGVSSTVTVVNEGTIHTTGAESIGIQAQSIGGGGGNAGLVTNLNMVSTGSQSSAFTVSWNTGGTGGLGNTAGAVDVTNRHAEDGTGGAIFTEGASAHGIVAESLGGGGGNGSSIVSVMRDNAGQDTISVGVGVGGDGGTGGTGGSVTVTNDAGIETKGNGANGIRARSLGGGGGSGGMVLAMNVVQTNNLGQHAGLATVGGSGGFGNSAGNVIVNNNGSIITRGANADGLVAQSIGGGGGDAGVGIPATSSVTSTVVAGVLSALLGGRGGSGAAGGAVTVNHSGDITVFGEGSNAVTAESLNGGGGGIALDFNGITSLPGGTGLPGAPEGFETDPVFVLHLGGTDTQTSNAELVTLNYTGTFGAAGDHGAGNNVQAIGGGGGTLDAKLGIVDRATAPEDAVKLRGMLGGVNGRNNDGGDVASMHAGNVVTTGLNTPALLMQSIGGGGGRANVVVATETGSLGDSTFGLGGENGADERGGRITHTQTGSIATSGSASHGALLQSIGGGGGVMSYLLSGGAESASAPNGADDAKPQRTIVAATSAADTSVAVTLGSAGGSGLDAKAVQLDLSGDVAIGGDHAVGLILQSIGGGGGTANVVGAGLLDVTIGGSAGASGDGGDLALTNTGNISSTGERSHGVVLQSIGGGGGAVLGSVSAPTVNLSADNSGDGGSITFAQIGDIVTSGSGARGLVAQSLGGGGGFVTGNDDAAFAGSAGGAGAGGAISLLLDGDLVTMSDGTTALFAQSVGTGGGGDIHAQLTADHHIVGAANGVAVAFDGGASNVFENHGSVMTLSGLTGTAFVGGAGDDSIVNDGVVIGNVALGGGANTFTNQAGATLFSGATLDLGEASNQFVNDGLLVPGADDLAIVTHLNGSLRQSADARGRFELDFGSDTLDALVATGSAAIDGIVDVSLLNTQAIRPGDFSKILYSAAGGLTDQGLGLATQPSVVITYGVARPDSRTATLGYSVDFAPQGLLGNRAVIGDYINRVQLAGSSTSIGPTISRLVSISDLESYSRALTQLGSEHYAEQQAHTLGSLQRFSRIMQDCGAMRGGRNRLGHDDCVWSRIDDHPSSHGSHDGIPRGQEEGRQYSFGFQRRVAETWTLGAGLGLEDNDTIGFDGSWSGESTVVEVGLLARRASGRTSAGMVLALGNSSQDVRRELDVTNGAIANGDRDISFVSGAFDLMHDFVRGGLVVTPAVTVGVSFLSGERMTESGAGGLDAVLASDDETHLWVQPTLAFGFERGLANRKALRVYARLGALQYLTSPTTEVRAGLTGAPAGVELMRIGSQLDRTHFLAEGGLELIAADRFTFALSYSRQTSDTRESSSTGARFAVRID